MPYATVAELASALNVPETPGNTPTLEACLQAAATEIDHHLALGGPVVEIDPGLLNRVNINRAVEWYKLPDSFNGTVGSAESGVLVTPVTSFARHAEMLLPLKTSWGIA